MPPPSDKWFSMRTDFFGYDAHMLGIYKLSDAALGVYVASVAYACQWGLDYVPRGIFRNIAHPRSRVRRELLDSGFLIQGLDSGIFHVAHEGALWRRGKPNTRRAIPLIVRAKVMERDQYQCVECGSTEALSLDHIHPYSLGGEDTVENLRVLCRSCNSAKGARV